MKFFVSRIIQLENGIYDLQTDTFVKTVFSDSKRKDLMKISSHFSHKNNTFLYDENVKSFFSAINNKMKNEVEKFETDNLITFLFKVPVVSK